MAGTLFGLALSQQHDSDGRPLAAGRLYVFNAGTFTPRDTYTDSGLTAGNEHPHPIVLDSRGRIPAFWLSDGSARVRLTDSSGVVHFDENCLVLGASSGEGGGGDTTDANAIFQAGDFMWQPRTGTRTGWVRANARTIGSATSGASERASADCESLFTHLWNTYSDTICPVSGGRGASAAADWSSNKPIATPDLRGRAPVGVDDMGNSAASRLDASVITTGSATAAMSVGGEDRHTLATSEIPAHTHTGSVSDINPAFTTHNLLNNATDSAITICTGEETATPALTINNAGGGGAHNNMPPFALGSWYIFLG